MSQIFNFGVGYGMLLIAATYGLQVYGIRPADGARLPPLLALLIAYGFVIIAGVLIRSAFP